MNSFLEICFFSFAIAKAIKIETDTCAVNAFVEATPISGPACVNVPTLTSREIDDPTTLQIPYTNAPFSLASFNAESVSAVSPD